MRTLPGGTRRWITAGALVALLITTTTACYGTWGIRESYRAYTATPANGGGITTEAGVTWLDGTGAAQGPFQWTVGHASLNQATETGYIQFSGGVHTKAHPFADGYLMELSLWNPRLELNGDHGTLVADLNYRPYVGFAPSELPDLEAALNVPFADVDLSGFDWTLVNGVYSITDATMTGIPAAMALIGWDQFYSSPVALDPLSVSFNAEMFFPGPIDLPRITVSKTTGLHAGDTVIVSGAGFVPASGNLGTRPPLSGQPGGSYVIFGRFADTWKPSAGAPSSARTVISQQWALPQASYDALGGAATPGLALIDQNGNFEVTLEITSLGTGTNPNHGVYSFPGSGAVNANYELSVPLEVSP